MQITSEKVLYAKRNIACYKILTFSKRSPYMNFRYQRGKLYKNLINYYFTKGKIMERGFHSFVSLREAKRALKNKEFNSPTHDGEIYKIYRFIIPKAAAYYEGIWFSRYKNYCSDSIRMSSRWWIIRLFE